jgi:hypothetical protein
LNEKTPAMRGFFVFNRFVCGRGWSFIISALTHFVFSDSRSDFAWIQFVMNTHPFRRSYFLNYSHQTCLTITFTVF